MSSQKSAKRQPQRPTENFIKSNREKAYSQHVKYNASRVAEKFLAGCNSNNRSPDRSLYNPDKENMEDQTFDLSADASIPLTKSGPATRQTPLQGGGVYEQSRFPDGRSHLHFPTSTVIKSELAQNYLQSSGCQSKQRSKFNSVSSYDRGTLYERGMKSKEIRKLNMEAATEREERQA